MQPSNVETSKDAEEFGSVSRVGSWKPSVKFYPNPPHTIAFSSSDGEIYHIGRDVLQGISGFSRTILSLPQTDDARGSPDAPIEMDECGEALEPFFCLCEGFLVGFRSFHKILDVALVARKYDALHILLALRAKLRTLAPGDPLKAYAIAGRFGWEEEAVYISTLARDLSISDMELDDIEHLPTMYYHRLNKLQTDRQRIYVCAVEEADPLANISFDLTEEQKLALSSQWANCQAWILGAIVTGRRPRTQVSHEILHFASLYTHDLVGPEATQALMATLSAVEERWTEELPKCI